MLRVEHDGALGDLQRQPAGLDARDPEGLLDEIANVLTNSRALDVRPSAITRKYNGADLDPQQIGRELKVGNVLTGHFVRQGMKQADLFEAAAPNRQSGR